MSEARSSPQELTQLSERRSRLSLPKGDRRNWSQKRPLYSPFSRIRVE
ncbi:MAG TPA: hypothetical protein V6C90_20165 [Coleofasciculaceae cyanobacterium]